MTATHRRTIARRAGRTAAVATAVAALAVGGASIASAAPARGEAVAPPTTQPWTVTVAAPDQQDVARLVTPDEGQGWLDALFGRAGDRSWSGLFGDDRSDPEDLVQGLERKAGHVPGAPSIAQVPPVVPGSVVPVKPLPGIPEVPRAAPGGSAPAVPTPARPAPVSPAPQAASLTSGEQAMLDAMNAQRASVGCAPLSADTRLTAAARAHASDMVDRGYFDHTSLDGSSPWDRAARFDTTASAENISAGQSSGSDAARDLWSSPGHRANIASCELTTVGIGNDVGDGAPTAVGGGTWVQLFAS